MKRKKKRACEGNMKQRGKSFRNCATRNTRRRDGLGSNQKHPRKGVGMKEKEKEGGKMRAGRKKREGGIEKWEEVMGIGNVLGRGRERWGGMRTCEPRGEVGCWGGRGLGGRSWNGVGMEECGETGRG